MCGNNSVLGDILKPVTGGPPSSKKAAGEADKFNADAAYQFNNEAGAATGVTEAALEEGAEGRGVMSQGTKTTNEGRTTVGEGRDVLGEGKTIRGQAQDEYAKQTGLRDQMISEGTITPDKLNAARSAAMGDVASAYQGARAAKMRSDAAMGVNPGDPGAGGGNAALVDLAAAQVGTGNVAALNERKYRTGVASGAIGEEQAREGVATGAEGTGGQIEGVGYSGENVGYGAQGTGLRSLASKTSGLATAGRMSGEAGAGMEKIGATQTGLQSTEEQENTSMIPTFSIKQGGKVSRGGFRPSLMRTHQGRVIPTRAAVAQGQIDGPGTGTSDGVDAKLSRGEYVTTAKATKALEPRTMDAQTEIGHRAAAGDPKAVRAIRRIKQVVHGAGFRAPVRIAGQEPQPAEAKTGGRLKAADRNALSSKSFGLPSERKYPMPDRSHAANAKARASQQVKRGSLSSAQKSRIDAKANRILNSASGGFRRDKVGTVMHEFKAGNLHSGSDAGPVVTNPKQAIAIAISEKKRAGGAARGGIAIAIMPFKHRAGHGFKPHAADGGESPWLQQTADDSTVSSATPRGRLPLSTSAAAKALKADDGGYLDQTDINAVPGMNAEESIAGRKNQDSLAAAGGPGGPGSPSTSRPSVNFTQGNQPRGNHVKVSDVVKLWAAAGG